MAKARVPYLHRWRNRHGKWENFARFPGRKQVRLRGDLFSEIFWADYQAAQTDAPRLEIGALRTKPGTVAAAIVAYYRSVPFLNLASSTQSVRRNILERFRAEHGDKRIVSLQRRHIAEMLAEKAATAPAAAQVFLKVLRALMQFCISVGLCNDDPTIGVKNVKLRSEGIYTWSESDIAKFEAHHPIGGRPRLAFALLLHTGQRRSDVIRMGRQHVRDGAIHLYAAEDRRHPGDPDTPGASRGHRSDAERPSYVPRHPRRIAIQSGRVRKPLSAMVQRGRVTERMLRARPAQSRLPPTRRGGLLGSGDHGDQWPCQFTRGSAVLRCGQSGADGALGDGERDERFFIQTKNINWQTFLSGLPISLLKL